MSSPIHNVLLDLGGVLYELDLPGMIARFNAHLPESYRHFVFSMEAQPAAFDRLDRGETNASAFLKAFRTVFPFDCSDQEIINIWNSLLIGVIPGREADVARIAERYPVALLSNTNTIHYEVFEPQTKTLFAPMKHLFLSFEMGLRKPEPEIFREVLRRTGWRAEETLYMDDGMAHIATARSLGFQTMLYQSEADWQRLMQHLGMA